MDCETVGGSYDFLVPSPIRPSYRTFATNSIEADGRHNNPNRANKANQSTHEKNGEKQEKNMIGRRFFLQKTRIADFLFRGLGWP